MGKVIILGGNARSGKTTLARRLQKEGYNRISLDFMNEVIDLGLNINIDELDKNNNLNYFEAIVNLSIKESIEEDIDIVIDMYDYLPADIDKLNIKDKVLIYFLAYPNTSKEDIKYNVTHYAKPTDWISLVNEDYLNECVERFYKRNDLLVKECNKYKMNLIDTKSGKDRDIVLDNLYNEIVGM